MGGADHKADRLQGLATATVEDQLCRVQSHAAELTLVGSRYLLSPPFECVTCKGGWVVLLHGLKLSTGYAGSGVSLEVQAKFRGCLCPAWCHPA